MKRKGKRAKPPESKSAYWPPELVASVLSRLPAESLMRFRSVFKTWSSLIESPRFISLHLANYTRNPQDHPRIISPEDISGDPGPRCVVVRPSDTFREIMKIILPDFGYKWVGGYVNELMLYHPARLDIFLFNPSIRRCIRRPSAPLLPSHLMRAALGFLDGDYKVVGILILCY